jgi:hypothetical protein
MASSFERSAVRVGLVTLAIGLLFAASHIARSDMNPTVFIAVGEESGEIREYAEELLDDVALRPALGHDGRFFFVQANDPWMLAPDANAAILDRPVYRAQRMAYPVLASLGGILPPTGVVWGMLVVNILAMSAGAFVCGLLAFRFGGSAWWGLAFPFNIGLISEFSIGGAGIVATAAAFAAVLLLLEEEVLGSSLLFALSCLAREVMLIAVAGAVVWLLVTRQPRIAARVAVWPVVAVVAWGAYIRLVLPGGGAVAEGNLGLPFVGFIDNFANWKADPFELLIGLVVVVVLVFYSYRALRNPSLTAWTFLPLAVLAFLLAEPVWDGYFNITRAVAPVLTAYFLITFAPSVEQQRRLVEESPLRRKV